MPSDKGKEVHETPGAGQPHTDFDATQMVRDGRLPQRQTTGTSSRTTGNDRARIEAHPQGDELSSGSNKTNLIQEALKQFMLERQEDMQRLERRMEMEWQKLHDLRRKERRQKRTPDILIEYQRTDSESSDYFRMMQNMHHILNGRESKVPVDQRDETYAMLARVEERLDWLENNEGRLMMNRADQQPAFVIEDPSARERIATDQYREADESEVQAYRNTLAARRTALTGNQDATARLERIELNLTEEALNKRYGGRDTSSN